MEVRAALLGKDDPLFQIGLPIMNNRPPEWKLFFKIFGTGRVFKFEGAYGE
jgi:hypothetical protein